MTTLPVGVQVLSPTPKAERGGGCPPDPAPSFNGQGKEEKEKVVGEEGTREGRSRKGEKSNHRHPHQKGGGIIFFQQVVNSVAPPSLTILIKLISPHAIMKSGWTKPPWNHENCAP